MARLNVQKSFKLMIKDELVSRFEDVVIDEINSYKESIKKRDQEIFELKLSIDNLFNLLEKQNQFIESQKNNLFEEITKCKYEIESYKEKSEKKINTNKEVVKETKSYVENILTGVYTKKEIDEIKSNLNNSLSENKQLIIDKGRENTNYINSLFELRDNPIQEYLFLFNQQLESIKNYMKNIENQTDSYIVETKGVLREFEIIKKELFVMSKKIENIYTILGRTPEGGKQCHKVD